jgi:predicted transcriptional regulator
MIPFNAGIYLLELGEKLEAYSREIEQVLNLQQGSIRLSLHDFQSLGYLECQRVLKELNDTIQWVKENPSEIPVLCKLVNNQKCASSGTKTSSKV